ncbi:MAG TPA: AMIN domain-containing protein [Terriglobales bacterium]|nr:AMIN domain-containing protein [Terriglobales bacterium]
MKRRLRHASSAVPKRAIRNSPPQPELCPPPAPKPPAGPALIFAADDASAKAWHTEAADIGQKARLWAWCEWLRLSLVAAAVITATFVLTAKTVAQRSYARTVRMQNAPSSSPARPVQPAAPAGPATVGAIHYFSDDNSTTVTVDLGALVFFDAQRLTGPDRVYFDLQQTRMPENLHGRLIQVAVGQTFVKKIRVAERGPDVTRVVLETTPNCVYSAMIAPDPYRLVVNLHAPK